jgi:hypothetical protein
VVRRPRRDSAVVFARRFLIPGKKNGAAQLKSLTNNAQNQWLRLEFAFAAA